MEEGEGLEVQLREGMKFCESAGYEYEVYEESVSGGKEFMERDEYRRMSDDIREGKIEGVYIRNVSRGWRDDRYKWSFVDMLNENKCRLFSGGKEIDLNDKKDMMFLGLESLMYDYNRYDIIKQTSDGRVNKWKKGLGYGGLLMYGYKRERENKESIIVVDKVRSRLVKDVYKLYSRKDCSDIMNCYERIRNKYVDKDLYDDINYRLIRKIIMNDYCGKLYINDKKNNEVYEFDVDEIIDKELNDKCKKKYEEGLSLKRGNNKENYLLKNKVNCKCGMKMWIYGSIGKNGSYAYYKCSKEDIKRRQKQTKGMMDVEISNISCSNKGVRVDLLEEVIWEGLFKFLERSEVLGSEYKKRVEEGKGKKNEFKGKLKYYEDELKKNKEKEVKSMDMVLDGLWSKDDYKNWKNKNDEKVKDINIRIENLEFEINKMNLSDDVFDDYVSLMKKDLNKEKNIKSFKDRFNKIRKYINNIVVDRIDKNNFKIDVFMNLDVLKNVSFEINNKNSKNKFYILNFLKYINGKLVYKKFNINNDLVLLIKYNKIRNDVYVEKFELV